MAPAEATFDVCVVGGCGRVGLPLGIALASRGLSVVLYDINAAAVDLVNAGTLPFAEEGAAEPLAEALAAGRLRATTDPASVGRGRARWSWSSAPRSTSTSTPTSARCRGRSSGAPSTCATASWSCCAAPSTRA